MNREFFNLGFKEAGKEFSLLDKLPEALKSVASKLHKFCFEKGT